MLTEQAQRALFLLHRRAEKAHDAFTLDRVDRALDEVLRLNSHAPAAFQVRSAWSHAGAVLRERSELAPSTPLSEVPPDREPAAIEELFAAIDLALWLATTPSLKPQQRAMLQQLRFGAETEHLAAEYGVPLPRMRERVSRLRRRARGAFASEVISA